MLHRAAAIVAAIAISPAVGRAQPAPQPLSRAEALGRALGQNPRIAAARAEEAKAEAQLGQARALRYPIIGLNIAVAPAQKAALVPGTAVQSTRNTYDMSWSDLTAAFVGDAELVQPLYTFGKISHRRDAAEHGVAARRAVTDMTRADVALEVARLYETYLRARDSARFLDEIDGVLDKSIQSTRDRMKAAKSGVSEQDLLRLQVAGSVARVGLHEAQAGMRESAAAIRAWLGLPRGDTIEVADDTLEALPGALPPIDRLIDDAGAHRPELAALREGASAHHALAAAEHAAWFPDFYALGLISAAYTPGRDLVETRYVFDPFYHFFPDLALGVRWTLQGDMPRRRADEQRAEARRMEATLAWALQGLPAEVRRHFEEVRRARADIEEADAGVGRAKQWLVRASADYDVGLGDSRGVTDAVQGYAMLRLQAIEARYRCNVELAELARATGALAGGRSALYPGGERSR